MSFKTVQTNTFLFLGVILTRENCIVSHVLTIDLLTSPSSSSSSSITVSRQQVPVAVKITLLSQLHIDE